MTQKTADMFIAKQEAIHRLETLTIQRKQLNEEINLLTKLKVVVEK